MKRSAFLISGLVMTAAALVPTRIFAQTSQPQPPIIIGDSIADGLAFAGKYDADILQKGDEPLTKSGRKPWEIWVTIYHYWDQVMGRDVVVSTGVSNNPDDVEVARAQIILLQVAGAARIVIIGVGDHPAYVAAHLNDKLAHIAEDIGAIFMGPLDTALMVHKQKDNGTPDLCDWGIHPTSEGYAELNQILQFALRPVPRISLRNDPSPK